MKKVLTIAGWIAGFIYGLLAVVLVWSDVPFGLQAFIVAGCGAVGASAGYLTGFIAESGTHREEN